MNMKKLFILIIIFNVFTYRAFLQTNYDVDNWYYYKVYTSGLTTELNDEMLSRTIEKKNLAVFTAFDYLKNEGYVIVENPDNMQSIKELINNNVSQVTIQNYQQEKYSDDLLFEIYCIRSNHPAELHSVQLPKYVSLGPKVELANFLYDKVKKIWINKYPDQYKKMTTPSNILTEEEIKEKQLKNNSKNE